ncbi:MAG TPA: SRPBCC family protein [Pseudonocardiaceae bacterium]|nr:SRPBCC family protein [Pseudonocardiaceae bacterium]
MRISHSFVVPVDVDSAWDVLLDVERIAPCMPGAALNSFDGDAFTGTVAVKLGAMAMKYAGSGQFVERDPGARRVVFEASGRETKGSGTAKATVTATLHPEGNTTRVDVDTDLAVAGRAAQFGRSIMNDVAGTLLDRFATSLSAHMTTPEPAAPVTAATPPAAPAANPEPIDLAALGRQVLLRRAALPLALIAMIVLVTAVLRRRGRH